MRTEDQYPSTSDCAPILGAQDDPVLLCLERSRARVAQGHTQSLYIAKSHTGEVQRVCAIGAIYAEDGFGDGKGMLPDNNGEDLYQQIEAELSAEAKEAIALLNQAAISLHPEAEEYGEWQGPLEWVNQDWVDEEWDDPVLGEREEAVLKAEILRIYDLAISIRAEAA